MPKNISQWLLGLALVIYPILCLVLVFMLALNPLGGGIDSDELTSNTLLPDFSAINQAPERKQLFIETLRPLVEQKNTLLLTTRERLIEIKNELAQQRELSFTNTQQLALLREDFNVSKEDYPSDARAVEILLLRVDVIPPAMVLAQAAVESGWGTSRFAVEANNFLGNGVTRRGAA